MQFVRFSCLMALGAVFVFDAPRASACSAPICPASVFMPQSSPTADAVPVVPENGAVVSLLTFGAPAEALRVRATRVRGGESSELELAVEGGAVRLDGALDGDLWTLRESHACELGGPSGEAATTVRVGPAAALPGALGTLSASAPARRGVSVADGSGPCSSEIDSVVVELAVELDASAEPWGDLLRYETRVDGERFPGLASTRDGPLHAAVFVACEPPSWGQIVPDLEEGVHVVQRVAFLPGSDVPIASDELEVTLRCDAGEGSSGCSISRGARASGSGLALVIGTLALVLARRRR